MAAEERINLRDRCPCKTTSRVLTCYTDLATDYYSAFGLAFQVATGNARGVQRGQTSALVGDALHPCGVALKGVGRRCSPPLKGGFARIPGGGPESRLWAAVAGRG